MQMNSDGARRWSQITKQNIGKAVAIVLDDAVYTAPRILSQIDGGNSQITGNFTIEDTKDLANTLNSGKMPAPTRIVQEEVVGPSLGAQSIQQGIISFIVAFVLLMIYMIMLYGFIPGILSDIALLFNLFFTLGILTSFQAALTMPGIAGIVLTLGTAVDANVLIYERIKEEPACRKGHEAGHQRRLQQRLLRYLRLQPYFIDHRCDPTSCGYRSYPRLRNNLDHRYLLLLLQCRVLDTSAL